MGVINGCMQFAPTKDMTCFVVNPKAGIVGTGPKLVAMTSQVVSANNGPS